jgi:hypothetical protein
MDLSSFSLYLQDMMTNHSNCEFKSFMDEKGRTIRGFNKLTRYEQMDYVAKYENCIKTWRYDFLMKFHDLNSIECHKHIHYTSQIDRFISKLISLNDDNSILQDIFVNYIQRCHFGNIIHSLNKNTQEKFNKSKILEKLIFELLEQIKLIMFVSHNKCPKYKEIDANIKQIANNIKTDFGHMTFTYSEMAMEMAMEEYGDSEAMNTPFTSDQKTQSMNDILDNIFTKTLHLYECNSFTEEEYNCEFSCLNGALTQYFDSEKESIIDDINAKIMQIMNIFKKKHLGDLKLPCGHSIISCFDKDNIDIHKLNDIIIFANEYKYDKTPVEFIEFFEIIDKLQSMDLTIYQNYLYECNYKINIYKYWEMYFPDVQLLQHAIVLIAHKIHYDSLSKNDLYNEEDTSFILSSFLDGSFDLSSTEIPKPISGNLENSENENSENSEDENSENSEDENSENS